MTGAQPEGFIQWLPVGVLEKLLQKQAPGLGLAPATENMLQGLLMPINHCILVGQCRSELFRLKWSTVSMFLAQSFSSK